MLTLSKSIAIIGTLCLGLAAAKTAPKSPVDTLYMEVERLTREKNNLLESLEKSEANRWQSRYSHSRNVEEKEEQLRKIESKYASEAAVLSQKQEAYIRASNLTSEKRTVLDDTKGVEESFGLQLSQSIDQTAEKLSTDFPVRIAERTGQLSNLSKRGTVSAERSAVLKDFLDYQSDRLELSYTSEIQQKNSLFQNQELNATSLRLGTVWMGEYAPAENRSQLLLRTGRLDGNVFVWRENLAGENGKQLVSAISSIKQDKNDVVLPLDVLQNKSISSGFVDNEQTGSIQKFIIWFKLGGIVMYPLAMAAILGLLLCMDRYFVIWRRSIDPIKLKEKLKPAILSKNWAEAIQISKKSKSSVGYLFMAIFKQAEGNRKSAEKSVRESMMKEIPTLEKRMLMLSAIGGAAPLMGLLGTVSGMISLFKVITDVGTNDPRILAAGISEALITTETGLVIAIPILLIQGYLNDRLDKIQNDMSTESAEMLNTIWPDNQNAA